MYKNAELTQKVILLSNSPSPTQNLRMVRERHFDLKLLSRSDEKLKENTIQTMYLSKPYIRVQSVFDYSRVLTYKALPLTEVRKSVHLQRHNSRFLRNRRPNSTNSEMTRTLHHDG
jgi:hypothetical protein